YGHNGSDDAAMDAALIARQRPDVGGFIIMSGDGDFTPLALHLRTLGKRVHIIARDSAISPALLAQADEVVLLETITGRAAPMSPTALRQAVTRLRAAISGLAGQSIATPVVQLPVIMKLVGVDAAALGFPNTALFQTVLVDLGLLRVNKTPAGDIIMPGATEPGKDTLDKLLHMMSLSVAENAKRKTRPSLIQVLEPIWKAEPDLDVTKKTPLVAIQILTIAERLNIITVERKPGEEARLLPGKEMK
ncbi:MAG: NYN domain-containing protein, partial [Ktedonobacterales bacterium]|nr:NYN domain-containing protein [Ktedonobacterales bacterium]